VIKLNIITSEIMGMKKSVDVLLVSALDHEELHNMGNAITDFSTVLKTEPGNIFALLGKARCLLYDFHNQGNLQEGLDIVKKLMDKHNQRSFDVYFLRARLLWRLRKFSDALNWIKLCESRFGGDSTELLFTKARILVTLQRLDEAEEIMHELPEKESVFVKGRIEFDKSHFISAFGLFREYIDDSSLCDAGAAVVNCLSAARYAEDSEILNQAIVIGKKFFAECENAIRVRIVAGATTYCLWEKSTLVKTDEEKNMCWNEIISITQRLQHLQKADHTLLYNKSIAYNRVGKFKDALVAVDESISFLDEEKNDHVGVDAVSGEAFRLAGYDREYMNSLHVRGETLFKMKEYDDCIRAFKKLLAYKKKQLRRFHPLENPMLKVFPKVLMDKTKKEGMTAEQMEEEIKRFNEIIFSSSSYTVFVKIAKCYESLGDKKKFGYWKDKMDEALKAKELVPHMGRKGVMENDSSPPTYPHIESETEEHKSSFFYHGTDYKNAKHREGRDKKHSEEIAETVCAFLNTDGGTIVIGVSDDQECLGVEADIKRTKKGTQDAYLQKVRIIENLLTDDFPNFIRYSIKPHSPEALGSKAVLLLHITVDKLPISETTPAMMTRDGKPVAYFRQGESDQPYAPTEGMRHMKRRAEKNRGSY
jgi:tetratricopeptide (TPR) repeat protein